MSDQDLLNHLPNLSSQTAQRDVRNRTRIEIIDVFSSWPQTNRGDLHVGSPNHSVNRTAKIIGI